MIWAIVTLAICGFLASFGLGLASKKFSVTIDPRIEKIEELVEGEEYIIRIIFPRKAQGLAKILEEHEEEIEFTIEEFEEFYRMFLSPT